MYKKILAFAIAIIMMLGSTCAMAENIKHERVWAVTDTDGNLIDLVDTVILENKDGSANISDKTILTNIQVLNKNGSFTQDVENLIWKTNGKDVYYQGLSDKPLPINPKLKVYFDGEEISSTALKNKTGNVKLNVSYSHEEDSAYIVVTFLLLPEDGIDNLKLENAYTIDISGRKAVFGWAVPGAEESLGLPTSFDICFDAKNVDIPWMMTVASGEPIDMLSEEVKDILDVDSDFELDDVVSLLKNIKESDELLNNIDNSGEISNRIIKMNKGIIQLNEGADSLAKGINDLSNGIKKASSGSEQLADGAEKLAGGSKSLVEGSAKLHTGLETLGKNSAVLNESADTIFEAIVESVNQQLASSALSESDIKLPKLTVENYNEVLTNAIEKTDPQKAIEQAYAKAESIVRPKVESNKSQIRKEITDGVQAQILESILKDSGINMDISKYAKAVETGTIDADITKKINEALDAQMKSDDVKTMIENTLTDQIDILVSNNVEEAMKAKKAESAKKLEQAQKAHDGLQALLDQLNNANAFVKGLKSYTNGVDKAVEGSSELALGTFTLNTGINKLSDGLKDLSEGTQAMSDGTDKIVEGATLLHDEGTSNLQTELLKAEKEAADKLLPVLTSKISEALNAWDNTRDQSLNAGYDLRPDDMKTTTIFIIRTNIE